MKNREDIIREILSRRQADRALYEDFLTDTLRTDRVNARNEVFHIPPTLTDIERYNNSSLADKIKGLKQ